MVTLTGVLDFKLCNKQFCCDCALPPFLVAVQNYGLPSRVCSDKWDKNVGAGIAICYGTGVRIGGAQLLGCLCKLGVYYTQFYQTEEYGILE